MSWPLSFLPATPAASRTPTFVPAAAAGQTAHRGATTAAEDGFLLAHPTQTAAGPAGPPGPGASAAAPIPPAAAATATTAATAATATTGTTPTSIRGTISGRTVATATDPTGSDTTLEGSSWNNPADIAAVTTAAVAQTTNRTPEDGGTGTHNAQTLEGQKLFSGAPGTPTHRLAATAMNKGTEAAGSGNTSCAKTETRSSSFAGGEATTCASTGETVAAGTELVGGNVEQSVGPTTSSAATAAAAPRTLSTGVAAASRSVSGGGEDTTLDLAAADGRSLHSSASHVVAGKTTIAGTKPETDAAATTPPPQALIWAASAGTTHSSLDFALGAVAAGEGHSAPEVLQQREGRSRKAETDQEDERSTRFSRGSSSRYSSSTSQSRSRSNTIFNLKEREEGDWSFACAAAPDGKQQSAPTCWRSGRSSGGCSSSSNNSRQARSRRSRRSSSSSNSRHSSTSSNTSRRSSASSNTSRRSSASSNTSRRSSVSSQPSTFIKTSRRSSCTLTSGWTIPAAASPCVTEGNCRTFLEAPQTDLGPCSSAQRVAGSPAVASLLPPLAAVPPASCCPTPSVPQAGEPLRRGSLQQNQAVSHEQHLQVPQGHEQLQAEHVQELSNPLGEVRVSLPSGGTAVGKKWQRSIFPAAAAPVEADAGTPSAVHGPARGGLADSVVGEGVATKERIAVAAQQRGVNAAAGTDGESRMSQASANDTLPGLPPIFPVEEGPAASPRESAVDQQQDPGGERSTLPFLLTRPHTQPQQRAGLLLLVPTDSGTSATQTLRSPRAVGHQHSPSNGGSSPCTLTGDSSRVFLPLSVKHQQHRGADSGPATVANCCLRSNTSDIPTPAGTYSCVASHHGELPTVAPSSTAPPNNSAKGAPHTVCCQGKACGVRSSCCNGSAAGTITRETPFVCSSSAASNAPAFAYASSSPQVLHTPSTRGGSNTLTSGFAAFGAANACCSAAAATGASAAGDLGGRPFDAAAGATTTDTAAEEGPAQGASNSNSSTRDSSGNFATERNTGGQPQTAAATQQQESRPPEFPEATQRLQSASPPVRREEGDAGASANNNSGGGDGSAASTLLSFAAPTLPPSFSCDGRKSAPQAAGNAGGGGDVCSPVSAFPAVAGRHGEVSTAQATVEVSRVTSVRMTTTAGASPARVLRSCNPTGGAVAVRRSSGAGKPLGGCCCASADAAGPGVELFPCAPCVTQSHQVGGSCNSVAAEDTVTTAKLGGASKRDSSSEGDSDSTSSRNGGSSSSPTEENHERHSAENCCPTEDMTAKGTCAAGARELPAPAPAFLPPSISMPQQQGEETPFHLLLPFPSASVLPAPGATAAGAAVGGGDGVAACGRRPQQLLLCSSSSAGECFSPSMAAATTGASSSPFCLSPLSLLEGDPWAISSSLAAAAAAAAANSSSSSSAAASPGTAFQHRLFGAPFPHSALPSPTEETRLGGAAAAAAAAVGAQRLLQQQQQQGAAALLFGSSPHDGSCEYSSAAFLLSHQVPTVTAATPSARAAPLLLQQQPQQLVLLNARNSLSCPLAGDALRRPSNSSLLEETVATGACCRLASPAGLASCPASPGRQRSTSGLGEGEAAREGSKPQGCDTSGLSSKAANAIAASAAEKEQKADKVRPIEKHTPQRQAPPTPIVFVCDDDGGIRSSSSISPAGTAATGGSSRRRVLSQSSPPLVSRASIRHDEQLQQPQQQPQQHHAPQKSGRWGGESSSICLRENEQAVLHLEQQRLSPNFRGRVVDEDATAVRTPQHQQCNRSTCEFKEDEEDSSVGCCSLLLHTNSPPFTCRFLSPSAAAAAGCCRTSGGSRAGGGDLEAGTLAAVPGVPLRSRDARRSAGAAREADTAFDVATDEGTDDPAEMAGLRASTCSSRQEESRRLGQEEQEAERGGGGLLTHFTGYATPLQGTPPRARSAAAAQVSSIDFPAGSCIIPVSAASYPAASYGSSGRGPRASSRSVGRLSQMRDSNSRSSSPGPGYGNSSSSCHAVAGSSGHSDITNALLLAGTREGAEDAVFQHPSDAFVKHLVEKHRAHWPEPQNLPGIQLEQQQRRWCASVYYRGCQHKRRFSMGRWGTLGAFYAAIEWRQTYCSRLLSLKQQGGDALEGHRGDAVGKDAEEAAYEGTVAAELEMTVDVREEVNASSISADSCLPLEAAEDTALAAAEEVAAVGFAKPVLPPGATAAPDDEGAAAGDRRSQQEDGYIHVDRPQLQGRLEIKVAKGEGDDDRDAQPLPAEGQLLEEARMNCEDSCVAARSTPAAVCCDIEEKKGCFRENGSLASTMWGRCSTSETHPRTSSLHGGDSTAALLRKASRAAEGGLPEDNAKTGFDNLLDFRSYSDAGKTASTQSERGASFARGAEGGKFTGGSNTGGSEIVTHHHAMTHQPFSGGGTQLCMRPQQLDEAAGKRFADDQSVVGSDQGPGATATAAHAVLVKKLDVAGEAPAAATGCRERSPYSGEEVFGLGGGKGAHGCFFEQQAERVNAATLQTTDAVATHAVLQQQQQHSVGVAAPAAAGTETLLHRRDCCGGSSNCARKIVFCVHPKSDQAAVAGRAGAAVNSCGCWPADGTAPELAAAEPISGGSRSPLFHSSGNADAALGEGRTGQPAVLPHYQCGGFEPELAGSSFDRQNAVHGQSGGLVSPLLQPQRQQPLVSAAAQTKARAPDRSTLSDATAGAAAPTAPPAIPGFGREMGSPLLKNVRGDCTPGSCRTPHPDGVEFSAAGVVPGVGEMEQQQQHQQNCPDALWRGGAGKVRGTVQQAAHSSSYLVVVSPSSTGNTAQQSNSVAGATCVGGAAASHCCYTQQQMPAGSCHPAGILRTGGSVSGISSNEIDSSTVATMTAEVQCLDTTNYLQHPPVPHSQPQQHVGLGPGGGLYPQSSEQQQYHPQPLHTHSHAVMLQQDASRSPLRHPQHPQQQTQPQHPPQQLGVPMLFCGRGNCLQQHCDVLPSPVSQEQQSYGAAGQGQLLQPGGLAASPPATAAVASGCCDSSVESAGGAGLHCNRQLYVARSYSKSAEANLIAEPFLQLHHFGGLLPPHAHPTAAAAAGNLHAQQLLQPSRLPGHNAPFAHPPTSVASTLSTATPAGYPMTRAADSVCAGARPSPLSGYGASAVLSSASAAAAQRQLLLREKGNECSQSAPAAPHGRAAAPLLEQQQHHCDGMVSTTATHACSTPAAPLLLQHERKTTGAAAGVPVQDRRSSGSSNKVTGRRGAGSADGVARSSGHCSQLQQEDGLTQQFGSVRLKREEAVRSRSSATTTAEAAGAGAAGFFVVSGGSLDTVRPDVEAVEKKSSRKRSESSRSHGNPRKPRNTAAAASQAGGAGGQRAAEPSKGVSSPAGGVCTASPPGGRCIAGYPGGRDPCGASQQVGGSSCSSAVCRAGQPQQVGNSGGEGLADVVWQEGFRRPFGTEGRQQLLRHLRQVYNADSGYWGERLRKHNIAFSRIAYATVAELWKISHVMDCFQTALAFSNRHSITAVAAGPSNTGLATPAAAGHGAPTASPAGGAAAGTPGRQAACVPSAGASAGRKELALQQRVVGGPRTAANSSAAATPGGGKVESGAEGSLSTTTSTQQHQQLSSDQVQPMGEQQQQQTLQQGVEGSGWTGGPPCAAAAAERELLPDKCSSSSSRRKAAGGAGGGESRKRRGGTRGSSSSSGTATGRKALRTGAADAGIVLQGAEIQNIATAKKSAAPLYSAAVDSSCNPHVGSSRPPTTSESVLSSSSWGSCFGSGAALAAGSISGSSFGSVATAGGTGMVCYSPAGPALAERPPGGLPAEPALDGTSFHQLQTTTSGSPVSEYSGNLVDCTAASLHCSDRSSAAKGARVEPSGPEQEAASHMVVASAPVLSEYQREAEEQQGDAGASSASDSCCSGMQAHSAPAAPLPHLVTGHHPGPDKYYDAGSGTAHVQGDYGMSPSAADCLLAHPGAAQSTSSSSLEQETLGGSSSSQHTKCSPQGGEGRARFMHASGAAPAEQTAGCRVAAAAGVATRLTRESSAGGSGSSVVCTTHGGQHGPAAAVAAGSSASGTTGTDEVAPAATSRAAPFGDARAAAASGRPPSAPRTAEFTRKRGSGTARKGSADDRAAALPRHTGLRATLGGGTSPAAETGCYSSPCSAALEAKGGAAAPAGQRGLQPHSATYAADWSSSAAAFAAASAAAPGSGGCVSTGGSDVSPVEAPASDCALAYGLRAEEESAAFVSHSADALVSASSFCLLEREMASEGGGARTACSVGPAADHEKVPPAGVPQQQQQYRKGQRGNAASSSKNAGKEAETAENDNSTGEAAAGLLWSDDTTGAAEVRAAPASQEDKHPPAKTDAHTGTVDQPLARCSTFAATTPAAAAASEAETAAVAVEADAEVPVANGAAVGGGGGAAGSTRRGQQQQRGGGGGGGCAGRGAAAPSRKGTASTRSSGGSSVRGEAKWRSGDTSAADSSTPQQLMKSAPVTAPSLSHADRAALEELPLLPPDASSSKMSSNSTHASWKCGDTTRGRRSISKGDEAPPPAAAKELLTEDEAGPFDEEGQEQPRLQEATFRAESLHMGPLPEKFAFCESDPAEGGEQQTNATQQQGGRALRQRLPERQQPQLQPTKQRGERSRLSERCRAMEEQTQGEVLQRRGSCALQMGIEEDVNVLDGDDVPRQQAESCVPSNEPFRCGVAAGSHGLPRSRVQTGDARTSFLGTTRLSGGCSTSPPIVQGEDIAPSLLSSAVSSLQTAEAACDLLFFRAAASSPGASVLSAASAPATAGIRSAASSSASAESECASAVPASECYFSAAALAAATGSASSPYPCLGSPAGPWLAADDRALFPQTASTPAGCTFPASAWVGTEETWAAACDPWNSLREAGHSTEVVRATGSAAVGLGAALRGSSKAVCCSDAAASSSAAANAGAAMSSWGAPAFSSAAAVVALQGVAWDSMDHNSDTRNNRLKCCSSGAPPGTEVVMPQTRRRRPAPSRGRVPRRAACKDTQQQQSAVEERQQKLHQWQWLDVAQQSPRGVTLQQTPRCGKQLQENVQPRHKLQQRQRPVVEQQPFVEQQLPKTQEVSRERAEKTQRECLFHCGRQPPQAKRRKGSRPARRKAAGLARGATPAAATSAVALRLERSVITPSANTEAKNSRRDFFRGESDMDALALLMDFLDTVDLAQLQATSRLLRYVVQLAAHWHCLVQLYSGTLRVAAWNRVALPAERLDIWEDPQAPPQTLPQSLVHGRCSAVLFFDPGALAFDDPLLPPAAGPADSARAALPRADAGGPPAATGRGLLRSEGTCGRPLQERQQQERPERTQEYEQQESAKDNGDYSRSSWCEGEASKTSCARRELRRMPPTCGVIRLPGWSPPPTPATGVATSGPARNAAVASEEEAEETAGGGADPSALGGTAHQVSRINGGTTVARNAPAGQTSRRTTPTEDPAAPTRKKATTTGKSRGQLPSTGRLLLGGGYGVFELWDHAVAMRASEVWEYDFTTATWLHPVAMTEDGLSLDDKLRFEYRDAFVLSSRAWTQLVVFGQAPRSNACWHVFGRVSIYTVARREYLPPVADGGSSSASEEFVDEVEPFETAQRWQVAANVFTHFDACGDVPERRESFATTLLRAPGNGRKGWLLLYGGYASAVRHLDDLYILELPSEPSAASPFADDSSSSSAGEFERSSGVACAGGPLAEDVPAAAVRATPGAAGAGDAASGKEAFFRWHLLEWGHHFPAPPSWLLRRARRARAKQHLRQRRTNQEQQRAERTSDSSDENSAVERGHRRSSSSRSASATSVRSVSATRSSGSSRSASAAGNSSSRSASAARSGSRSPCAMRRRSRGRSILARSSSSSRSASAGSGNSTRESRRGTCLQSRRLRSADPPGTEESSEEEVSGSRLEDAACLSTAGDDAAARSRAPQRTSSGGPSRGYRVSVRAAALRTASARQRPPSTNTAACSTLRPRQRRQIRDAREERAEGLGFSTTAAALPPDSDLGASQAAAGQSSSRSCAAEQGTSAAEDIAAAAALQRWKERVEQLRRTPGTACPGPRFGHSLTAVGSRVFLFGGVSGTHCNPSYGNKRSGARSLGSSSSAVENMGRGTEEMKRLRAASRPAEDLQANERESLAGAHTAERPSGGCRGGAPGDTTAAQWDSSPVQQHPKEAAYVKAAAVVSGNSSKGRSGSPQGGRSSARNGCSKGRMLLRDLWELRHETVATLPQTLLEEEDEHKREGLHEDQRQQPELSLRGKPEQLTRGWRWRLCTCKGTPPAARSSHRAVAVGLHLLIFGGYAGRYVNDMYDLNTGTLVWTLVDISPLAVGDGSSGALAASGNVAAAPGDAPADERSADVAAEVAPGAFGADWHSLTTSADAVSNDVAKRSPLSKVEQQPPEGAPAAAAVAAQRGCCTALNVWRQACPTEGEDPQRRHQQQETRQGRVWLQIPPSDVLQQQHQLSTGTGVLPATAAAAAKRVKSPALTEDPLQRSESDSLRSSSGKVDALSVSTYNTRWKARRARAERGAADAAQPQAHRQQRQHHGQEKQQNEQEVNNGEERIRNPAARSAEEAGVAASLQQSSDSPVREVSQLPQTPRKCPQQEDVEHQGNETQYFTNRKPLRQQEMQQLLRGGAATTNTNSSRARDLSRLEVKSDEWDQTPYTHRPGRGGDSDSAEEGALDGTDGSLRKIVGEEPAAAFAQEPQETKTLVRLPESSAFDPSGSAGAGSFEAAANSPCSAASTAASTPSSTRHPPAVSAAGELASPRTVTKLEETEAAAAVQGEAEGTADAAARGEASPSSGASAAAAAEAGQPGTRRAAAAGDGRATPEGRRTLRKRERPRSAAAGAGTLNESVQQQQLQQQRWREHFPVGRRMEVAVTYDEQQTLFIFGGSLHYRWQCAQHQFKDFCSDCFAVHLETAALPRPPVLEEDV